MEGRRGPQRTPTTGIPLSPVGMGRQVILIPSHPDIVGGLVKSVEVVYKIGHKHSKQKKTINRNWGLLLYMKRADPEEVHNIKDKVIEYLNESARGTTSRIHMTCFVCGWQARGHNHNVKDCIQIVDVSLQANGQLRYAKGSGRVLNNCVRGFHTHQTYADQLACATRWWIRNGCKV